MATPSTKQWGISRPISTALPEPLDNEKTADLIEELKRENNYEPHEETKKRMSTLGLLNRVTQEFVREVSRKQGLPQSQIDQFGGKIYPYGSYRLGVFGPGKNPLMTECWPRAESDGRQDPISIPWPLPQDMSNVKTSLSTFRASWSAWQVLVPSHR